MAERLLPVIQKLVEAEQVARKNARPEPLFTDPKQLEPRHTLPTAEDIREMKSLYGIRYLGDPKRS